MSKEVKLGIKEMPKGYKLMRNSDGYYYWFKELDSKESRIHWNKWTVYALAMTDSELKAY